MIIEMEPTKLNKLSMLNKLIDHICSAPSSTYKIMCFKENFSHAPNHIPVYGFDLFSNNYNYIFMVNINFFSSQSFSG